MKSSHAVIGTMILLAGILIIFSVDKLVHHEHDSAADQLQHDLDRR